MAKFRLSTVSFKDGGEIPKRFTADGEDVSPALDWHNAPEGTKSFALIVDDPDAPDPKHPNKEPWVHWVVYDISEYVSSLEEGFPKGFLGINDFNQSGYKGPNPPIGKHRYFFKLYALDCQIEQYINGNRNPKKKDLEKAMEGHILAMAPLIGTYEKQKRGRGVVPDNGFGDFLGTQNDSPIKNAMMGQIDKMFEDDE
jgi:hypothetical protein